MFPDDGSSYSLVHRRYHPFFAAHTSSQDYSDIYIISPGGRVVYSVTKSNDFMEFIGAGADPDSRIATLFRATIRSTEASTDLMADFEEDARGSSALFSIPIRSPQGTIEAVLMIRFPTRTLTRIMQRPAGLGRTGEVFLVGQDRRLRTEPRGAAPVVIRAGGRDSPAVTAAFANRRGVVRQEDGQGAGVVAAFVPVTFRGNRYAVIAQQSEAEILTAAQQLREGMMRDGVLALYLVTILGLVIARSMSVPLTRVGEVMTRVARRDFEGTIPDRTRRDEIGSIARQLDAFRASLAASDGLERENAFKGAAFQATSAALMLADRNLTIIYVNQSLVELMKENAIAIDRQVPDFRPDALPGRNVTTFFPGALRVKSEGVEPYYFREEIRLGQRHIVIGMGPVLNAEGEVLGYVIEWEDGTQAQLNRVVLDTIDGHMPIAGFSADGRLIDANAQFEDWLGASRAELLGRSWDWLFAGNRGGKPDPKDQVAWTEVAKSGQDRGSLFEVQPATGGGQQMTVCVNAVRDVGGLLQRYVLLAPGTVFRGLGHVAGPVAAGLRPQ